MPILFPMEITFYWKLFPSNKSDDQQENVIFISGEGVFMMLIWFSSWTKINL